MSLPLSMAKPASRAGQVKTVRTILHSKKVRVAGVVGRICTSWLLPSVLQSNELLVLFGMATGVLFRKNLKVRPHGKRGSMKSGHYDIVRRVNESRLLWLESAEDLDRAKRRIQELTSFWPGEFRVLDQDSHRLVAAIDARTDSTDDRTDRD